MPAPKDPQRYEEWKRELSERAKKQMSDPAMKQRISISNKGKHNKPHTEEAKAKISAAKRGKPNPKIAAARRGKPRSPETIAKMSAVNKGVKWSEERKKAHSIAMQKRVITPELREQYSAATRGRKRTPAELQKVSQTLKSKPIHVNSRKNLTSPEARAKATAKQKARFAAMSPEEQSAFVERCLKARKGTNKNTSLEVFVSSQLDKFGIVYEQQKHIARYVIDFYIPDQNMIIETNGCFWHGCEQCGRNEPSHLEQREHDGKRTAYLESRGYVVIVLWEHDLKPFMKVRGE